MGGSATTEKTMPWSRTLQLPPKGLGQGVGGYGVGAIVQKRGWRGDQQEL